MHLHIWTQLTKYVDISLRCHQPFSSSVTKYFGAGQKQLSTPPRKVRSLKVITWV